MGRGMVHRPVPCSASISAKGLLHGGVLGVILRGVLQPRVSVCFGGGTLVDCSRPGGEGNRGLRPWRRVHAIGGCVTAVQPGPALLCCGHCRCQRRGGDRSGYERVERVGHDVNIEAAASLRLCCRCGCAVQRLWRLWGLHSSGERWRGRWVHGFAAFAGWGSP